MAGIFNVRAVARRPTQLCHVCRALQECKVLVASIHTDPSPCPLAGTPERRHSRWAFCLCSVRIGNSSVVGKGLAL